MKKQYLVAEPKDFYEVIKAVLSLQTKNNVITLSGDLGAGKTAFTQELGKFLGVTEPITSPTFTIMKQYPLSGDLFETLVHIDAYRIESESEVKPLHLESFINNPKDIVCIEWPERITSIIPKNAINIYIEIKEGDKREVVVSSS